VLTEQDGTFRRLIETVKARQTMLSGRPGRPPKNRVPTTGHFVSSVHERMKALSKDRTHQSDHLISVSDLYNEASVQLVADLHTLLGDEMRLPAGAVTLSAILGLRELIDRPMLTPLRELSIQGGETQRTTLYFDRDIWDAMIEMSLRFSLQLRRSIHVHRLLEMAAAWYLAGLQAITELE
jgi:hypothetical protein